MQVLKQKYGVLFSGVLSLAGIVSFRVVAGKGVMEDVSMVILSVGVARQPEQSWDRDYQHGGTVKRVNVTVHDANGISHQGVAPDCQNEDEGPKTPVWLNQFVGEEVLQS